MLAFLACCVAIANASEWQLFDRPIQAADAVPEWNLFAGEAGHPAEPVAADTRVLLFTASYCGPCRAAKPVAVPYLERGGWPVTEIDVESDQELSRQYGVNALPTFVVVIDGQEQGRVVGYSGARALKDQLRDVITNANAQLTQR